MYLLFEIRNPPLANHSAPRGNHYASRLYKRVLSRQLLRRAKYGRPSIRRMHSLRCHYACEPSKKVDASIKVALLPRGRCFGCATTARALTAELRADSPTARRDSDRCTKADGCACDHDSVALDGCVRLEKVDAASARAASTRAASSAWLQNAAAVLAD